MRVYDGSLWMSAGSSVNGTSRRYRYIATAGQTTFTGVDSNGATLAYDPLYLDVYLNGSRLDQSDYTATSGSSIVLATGAALNEEVNIVAFGTFAVATHVLKTGDTMTGQLTVPTIAGATTLTLKSNGTTAVTIDTSQNVGIGTSSPTTGMKTDVAGYVGSSFNGASNDSTVGSYSFINTNASASANPVRASIEGGRENSAWGAYLKFSTSTGTSAATEKMRIDSSGNLLVGVSSGTQHIISKNAGNGAGTTNILEVQNAGQDSVAIFLSGTSYGTSNSAGTSLRIGRSNTTSRSINAGGTINASGADYAEYMTKAGDFTVSKGDVIGINAEGKLTNVFSDAVSFAVKSTDPSYVGNDKWGCDFSEDPDGLEAARQLVDRIAFAGQVPVNVMGATAGQYIVPVNDNGAIKGIAKSEADMTLAEYMKAVGKVISIQDDGRAFIIVKVA